MCVCVCVCDIVCTNVHIKIVWVYAVYTQPSSKHFGSLIVCFLVSASFAAVPSDRLAAVRIEGIKGEVTMMSKAACFPLSQLRTSTVHPLARYGLGQV